jgi:hypothetical protein
MHYEELIIESFAIMVQTVRRSVKTIVQTARENVIG